VPELELVGVPVGDPLLVMLAVILDVSEILGVILALAPKVTDGVAEFDKDELRDGVDEGVCDAVLVPDAVPEPVFVCVGVGGDVLLAVNDAVGVGDGVSDEDGVPLAEPPADKVVVGVAVTVVERLTDADPLSLLDRLCVVVGETVTVEEELSVVDPL